MAAGVVIALNIGKLPPALPVLRREFGLTLVQVSWMVSLLAIAPALIGVVAGSIADRLDARRTMIAGLLFSAAANVLGAYAPSGPVLFASRALESVGFLAATLPAPSLIARLVAHDSLRGWLGIWSAYMPAGMGIALFATPAVMALVGWRGAWLGCAAAAVIAAGFVAVIPPADLAREVSRRRDGGALPGGEVARIGRLVFATLRSPGPWLLALCFLFFAGQFITIFSFLPSIYQDAGLTAQAGATLTAIAMIVNMAGNLAAGFLLQHGGRRVTLIAAAGVTMAACEWLAFGADLSFTARYSAILVLSAVAGLIPGTLFATAHCYAPSPAAVSATVGIMQQGSSLGQLTLPLAIATLVQYTGGWHSMWIATGLAALATVAIACGMGRYDRIRLR